MGSYYCYYHIYFMEVVLCTNHPSLQENLQWCQSVINYLGKYTHRIAISNHRIIRMDENTVTYYVKDYREKGKWKEFTISGVEFILKGPVPHD